MVTSPTLPHSTLSKRHNILAFHRVREAIAAKIIDFHWIRSEHNLSDMLSKHWEHNKIFPMIQKLLITCGPITLIQGQPQKNHSSHPHSRVSTTYTRSSPSILHFTYYILTYCNNRSLPLWTLLAVLW